MESINIKFGSLWRKGGAAQFGAAEIRTDLQRRAEIATLPAVEFCLGVTLSQAANSRPDLKECGSVALRPEAASAPTPVALSTGFVDVADRFSGDDANSAR